MRRPGRLVGILVGLVSLVGAPLGVIVMMSSPAAATTVTDETTFRAAWTNAAETQIDLAADITLTCGGGGVAVRNSATALTLDGHGHTITQTCANNGVLEQDGTGALTFQNVTVTGGHVTGVNNGGGILASGPVTLTQSTVTGNSAGGAGGGIKIDGSLTVNLSVISNDTAGSDGGGVFAQGGAVIITDSTLSGNTATGGGGGALFRDGSSGGDVAVTNSTVSDNHAPTPGQGTGGIDTLRPITLINSTVTNNSGSGGGVSQAGGGATTLIYSTIVGNTSVDGNVANVAQASGSIVAFGSVVALPIGAPNCELNSATTTSNGWNFSDDTSCGFTAATDRQNAGDPGLGPLSNNGGPTQTRLPQPGSPLIDAIPVASCQADGASGITTDQRGITRPQGAGCDIGAVEVQVVAPAPVVITPKFTG